eukprot:1543876-Rhodomonas_salina.1
MPRTGLCLLLSSVNVELAALVGAFRAPYRRAAHDPSLSQEGWLQDDPFPCKRTPSCPSSRPERWARGLGARRESFQVHACNVYLLSPIQTVLTIWGPLRLGLSEWGWMLGQFYSGHEHSKVDFSETVLDVRELHESSFCSLRWHGLGQGGWQECQGQRRGGSFRATPQHHRASAGSSRAGRGRNDNQAPGQ